MAPTLSKYLVNPKVLGAVATAGAILAGYVYYSKWKAVGRLDFVKQRTRLVTRAVRKGLATCIELSAYSLRRAAHTKRYLCIYMNAYCRIVKRSCVCQIATADFGTN